MRKGCRPAWPPGAADPVRKQGKTYFPGVPFMLAKNGDDEDMSRVAGWVYSEKMDGIRVIWNGCALVTRPSRGKEAKAFNSAPAWFLDAMPRGVALDGELWAGRGGFKDVSGISNRAEASDSQWERVEYRVFDSPSRPAPLAVRVAAAARALARAEREWSKKYGGTERRFPAKMVDYRTASGDGGVRRQVREEMRRVVGSGGEGLVFRNPASAYEGGRSPDMLKFKGKRDTEVAVEELVPGKGKHSGAMGALVGREIGTGVRVSVGTGFTDAERRAGAAMFPAGSVVRVSFFERTASGKLRHPVFDGLREDD